MTDEPKGEPKDQRIPIMMSASEVKAIDDWMFDQRIRSRADAIRRLCQIGLAFHQHQVDSAQQKVMDGYKSLIDAISEESGPEAVSFRISADEAVVIDEIVDALDVVADASNELFAAVQLVYLAGGAASFPEAESLGRSIHQFRAFVKKMRGKAAPPA